MSVAALDIARIQADLRGSGLNRLNGPGRAEVDVGDQRHAHLRHDPSEGGRIGLSRHGEPNQPAPRPHEIVDLPNAQIDIRRGHLRHRLDDDGGAAAELYGTNLYGCRGSSLDHGQIVACCREAGQTKMRPVLAPVLLSGRDPGPDLCDLGPGAAIHAVEAAVSAHSGGHSHARRRAAWSTNRSRSRVADGVRLTGWYVPAEGRSRLSRFSCAMATAATSCTCSTASNSSTAWG